MKEVRIGKILASFYLGGILVVIKCLLCKTEQTYGTIPKDSGC